MLKRTYMSDSLLFRKLIYTQLQSERIPDFCEYSNTDNEFLLVSESRP